MSEHEVSKIIYYFDKFARDIFITIDRNNYSSPQDRVLSSINNVVVEGSVLAKVIKTDDYEYNSQNPNIEDFNGNPLSCISDSVRYNETTREFISQLYGFVIFKDRKFYILPFFEVENNNLEAYVYIYPTVKDKYPTVEEVKKILKINNIVHCFDDSIIESNIEGIKADKGIPKKRILVASGVPPTDGVIEMLELKKVFKRSVGKELEDGRIDYKERSLFNTVKQGEVIVERVPEVLSKEGVDIFGNPIKGNMQGENFYQIGNNIAPKEEASNSYISLVDGIINIDEDRVINVEEKLTIAGDVNLAVGNIHFSGFIEISGNIHPGFKIDGTKDIVIHGNIEDAFVKSDGNIIVDNGILGKDSCKVLAGGNINARFIQNSDIMANKDIIVSESMVQARCFARGHIKVMGHIVGGEAIGLMGLEAGVLGGASGAKTLLVAGKDPETEERINKLTESIHEYIIKLKDLIGEVTLYFGENALTNVKSIVAHLPTNRKKHFFTMLKNIKDINGNIINLRLEVEKLKASIDFATPPVIKIHEGVFPGITVKIRTSTKKIDKRVEHNITFKENNELKTIYWD